MPAVGGAPHKLAGVQRLAAQAAAGLKAELTWRRPDGDFAYQFRVCSLHNPLLHLFRGESSGSSIYDFATRLTDPCTVER